MDLIIVEWSLAVNTVSFLEELDRVVQKLLRFWDTPPAIIFVNFFFWCRGNLWCRGYEVGEDGEGTPVWGREKPKK